MNLSPTEKDLIKQEI